MNGLLCIYFSVEAKNRYNFIGFIDSNMTTLPLATIFAFIVTLEFTSSSFFLCNRYFDENPKSSVLQKILQLNFVSNEIVLNILTLLIQER